MNNIDIILIFVCILIIMLSFQINPCTFTNNSETKESFVEKADCSDAYCDDTTLLEINNELLQSPMRYMSVDEFNVMILDIQSLVVDKITIIVKNCSDVNGADGFQRDQMTFTCLNDVEDIEVQVIDLIVAYIVKRIKDKYNINLNPYVVTSDFRTQLDFLDSIVYPLVYSKFYTVQGINYFTQEMLVNKVQENLKIQNILFTTLLRRGINVLPNDDDHGQTIENELSGSIYDS